MKTVELQKIISFAHLMKESNPLVNKKNKNKKRVNIQRENIHSNWLLLMSESQRIREQLAWNLRRLKKYEKSKSERFPACALKWFYNPPYSKRERVAIKIRRVTLKKKCNLPYNFAHFAVALMRFIISSWRKNIISFLNYIICFETNFCFFILFIIDKLSHSASHRRCSIVYIPKVHVRPKRSFANRARRSQVMFFVQLDRVDKGILWGTQVPCAV